MNHSNQTQFYLKQPLRHWTVPLLLIFLGFAVRLLPHPANFTPIGAIALFGAMYLPRRWALIVPLVALFASDWFIGFYSWKIMISVYGSFVIMGLIGLWVRKHKRFAAILGGTILGSLVFYLVTNTAVWAFGTMYPHNLTGLFQSYIMAIPFFRNSLAGNVFYVGVLIGGMELVYWWVASQKRALIGYVKETSERWSS